VIAALGLVKPIVMGHSMGSAAAMWFAARHPDVPRAVVLEDPALRMARPLPAEPPPPAAEPTDEQVANAEAELQGHVDEIMAKNNMTFGELLANQRATIAGTWGKETPAGGVDEMVERWA
jgi:pimeloyl-ACP methyl ester carboxylesterase